MSICPLFLKGPLFQLTSCLNNIIMFTLKVLIGDIIIIIIIILFYITVQHAYRFIIAILISYQTYYTTPLMDKKENYIASYSYVAN